jgi:glycogen(starch) synthase
MTGAEVAAYWLASAHAPYRQQIHFTGWLSPQHVAHWYEVADILVVPSRYEPFGMVVLEGMLYGLPIVAADVGGPAAILAHGQTGLLFPPRDVQALSAALRWLLAKPEERQRIGQAAAREVRSKWLWQQQMPAMLNVYRELLPAPVRHRRR